MVWAIFHVSATGIKQTVVAPVLRTVAVLVSNGSGDHPTPRARGNVLRKGRGIRKRQGFVSPGSRRQEWAIVLRASLLSQHRLVCVLVPMGNSISGTVKIQCHSLHDADGWRFPG